MSDKSVWKMVKEVTSDLNREITNWEIKEEVNYRYPGTNYTTINCAITAGAVNNPSRIHYNPNQKPRLANTEADYLFKLKDGVVEPYDSNKHGLWEIYSKDEGTLGVRLIEDSVTASLAAKIEEISEDVSKTTFALESHLRDYLARNLHSLSGFTHQLKLYSDAGRNGVEFQTEVGNIDILAISETGEFYVFELKLGKGPDSAVGQILRYIGWIKEHLSNGKAVHGVIVAEDISAKLKYAASTVPHISLMEYSLKFDVRKAGLKD